MHEPNGQHDLFSQHRALPTGLRYAEDFVSAADEAALLAELERLPFANAQYKEWTANRRIVSYGGRYDFSKNELEPAGPIPPFLLTLRAAAARFVGVPAAELTHALVAEYRAATQLGWHRDVGEFGIVVGVSLGGACRMRFRRYPPEKGAKVFNLELAPRSVYVMRDEIRWRWQHSVARTKELRYSVTFRTPR